jgi:hypothetical protein
MTDSSPPLAENCRLVAHLDLAGAGQVTVDGDTCYVGHLPSAGGLGTTILDISDPRRPEVLATIDVGDKDSHSHKVRVAGDVMIVNHERNNTGIGRKAEQLPPARARLTETLGRAPSHAELAAAIGVGESDIPLLEEAEKTPYDRGGFRVYDIADKRNPRLICHKKTGGKGVHRFDMDEKYAYISTEMEGYVGNILVAYDLADPASPEEVSRWWLPGQHLAGGETPDWQGNHHRLHHALRFGDWLYAAVWHAGFRIVDVADIAAPKTVGAYNYHPPFPEPTHTAMPLPDKIGDREIMVAIDEEDQFYNAGEALKRRGRPHAGLSTYDITDPANIKPLAIFQVSELDSPWSRAANARFGSHQFHERPIGTLIYCAWFAGGLRVVDVADPLAPQEVGWFMPEPVAGQPAPQTNDVAVDRRGLVHLVDRYVGYDIVEFDG